MEWNHLICLFYNLNYLLLLHFSTNPVTTFEMATLVFEIVISGKFVNGRGIRHEFKRILGVGGLDE